MFLGYRVTDLNHVLPFLYTGFKNFDVETT